MERKLESKSGLSILTLDANASNVFYAKVSSDFHTENTNQLEAVTTIYPEALLSGAGKYNRETFLDAVNSLGADISVNVTNNVVTFVLRSQADKATKLVSLFKVLLEAPTFSTNEIKRVKKQVVNELSELNEEARHIAQTKLQNTLFQTKDRRYHCLPNELSTQVEKVKSSDLVKLHNEILRSEWSITVGTDTKAIKNFVSQIKRVRPKEILARQSLHQPQKVKSCNVLTDIPSKQNIEFSIGAPLPLTVHHPDFVPFIFGLNVLGKWGGFAGRLMSTVREKEGLTYGIYARTEAVTGNETGYWRIMTFFNPQDATKGLTSTSREIRKLISDGITDDEYKRFKNILKTQQLLLNDSYVRNIDDLHNYHLLKFDLSEIDAIKEKLSRVTKKEVNEALKKYLHLDQLVISGAGPIRKAPRSLSKVRI